ncbi:MAG TPA: hypothetical protein VNK41_12480 [Vicinamibacterales bacterium]|nr:hypothetical protein [Vicinamibacterales bacterium]
MTDTHGNASGLRVVDLSTLRALGAETGLGTERIAALFAEQMVYQLEDLYASIQSGSLRRVSDAAHRCLGSATLAGMEQLSALLRALATDPACALHDPDACVSAVEHEFAAAMNELQVLTEGADIGDVA